MKDVERLKLHGQRERGFGHGNVMVFVVALSLMAGFFGSAHQDVVAVLLTVMVTTMGIVTCGSCRWPCSRSRSTPRAQRTSADPS
ncbi:hypothetical protein ACWC2M_22840 [Streptomyces sp. NPDC001761]